MAKLDALHFDHDRSIVNFSNSLLAHFGAKTHHATIPEVDEALKGRRKVVVFLFDGLAKNIMERHLKEGSFMRQHVVSQMEATFPPTTVASTTGFLSGRYPVENGWLAWSQWNEAFGCNIEPFTNRNMNTRELMLPRSYGIQTRFAPYASIFEQIRLANPEVKVHDIRPSHLSGQGVKNLRDARKALKKALASSDPCFVYFYWPSPDHELHAEGLSSRHVHRLVNRIDRFVKKVTEENPDTLFFSIADHGLIDVHYTDLCVHEDLYSLLERPLSMEKRVVTYFVKEGKQEEFRTLFERYYGDEFVLLSKEEVRDIHLFGVGDEHPLFEKAIGDFVSVSVAEACLYASKDYPGTMHYHVAAHAGFTPGEMEINIGVYNR